MKQYIKLCISFCALMAFTGCKKLVDTPPKSQITSASYWKTDGDVIGYMTGINDDFRDLLNNTLYYEDRSDVFVLGLEGAVTNAWSQTLTGANAPNWIDFYNLVHHCNLVLKYAPGISTVTPGVIDRSIAQAHFFRAYLYFSLIRIWGDVPLVLEPTESADTPLPSRAPAAEIMTQILSDLDQSIASFPESGFVNKNLVSKPAAYALRADALLWKNKVLQGTTADLEGVITASNLALASGVSLLPDFSKIHATDQKKNSEIIYSIYFKRDEKSDQYGSRLKPRDIFVATASNVTSLPYAIAGARSVYAPSPKIMSLFANNDVRKANSFITAVRADNTVIGIFDNKFRGTVFTDLGDRLFDNDIVLYRAAEMYLFKAEALAALNRVSEAKTELDRVRERTGTGVYTGSLDKVTFERELLNERGREFWLENKRWPDIVRFHYGGTINAYTEVPNLVGKAIPLFSPILDTQISLNPNLKQTVGYPN